jgi:hypothetical protein
MRFTNKTLAWAWLVVLCLVASSASGLIADRDIVWWVLGGIVAPAFLLTFVSRLWRPATAADRPAAPAEANDVMRMDSDKG